jgi:LuxR family maltose regulon positive regulatory protein
MSLVWGAGGAEKVLLRQWLEQLPTDIVSSRPRLSLACAQMLWTIASPTKLQAWLDMAETALNASLTGQVYKDSLQPILMPQERREQENLLGEVIAFRALLKSFQGKDELAFELCQQALSLLSEKNALARAHLAFPQMIAYYTCANDVVAATGSVLHGSTLAQEAGYNALAISTMGATVFCMTGAGRLGEANQMAQQAIYLGTQVGGFILPDVGWPTLWQADILREWNRLDAARALVEEAISLCRQTESTVTSMYLVCGYAMLTRVCLSRGELKEASSALQEVENIGRQMNHPIYLYFHSLYTAVDQVRLWLVCEELDRVARWVRELDLLGPHGTPFAREREEVARVRFLLATHQPAAALQRLEPVLERATMGKRWNHVIEVRLLQALAYQMSVQEGQALSVLFEAVSLAEPGGYIRSFVDEGAPMAALLSQLREQQRISGPTPYLDSLLEAFPRRIRKRQPKQVKQSTL